MVPSAGDLLAQGDLRGGVGRVMEELGPTVHGLLCTIFRRDPAAAEEAFSRFAENLWRSAATYRGEGPLKAWVYAIARNAALSIQRDGWRRFGERLRTEECERLAEAARTRSALRLERRSSALDALRDTLELDEQLLLTLRLDEALPWDQVALVMSSPTRPVEPAALRKRFERIKVRLAGEAHRRGLVG